MFNLLTIKKYHATYSNWPLTVLRVSVGIMFVIAAYHKLAAGSQWPDRMLGFLNFQADKSYEFYRAFLEAVVIPNHTVFGYLVAYGETFVAISLILGVFTRCGAAIGLFMVTNFLMVKGGAFWAPSANDPMFILVLFTIIFTDSGKVLGLDGIMIKKWPNLKFAW